MTGLGSAGCARRLVTGLVDAGVREAVMAPGSRSAPLAYALHEADAAGRLRLHVRIDERGAAFLAHGLAKASGRPVPVITTSGTAVANLHPAVLEAAHSGVPLLVISADRPSSMINTGANQTTVQRGLFGPHVRAEAQLDAATASAAVIDFQLRRLLAVASGVRSGQPGPVHLNVAFADPLVPDAHDLGDLESSAWSLAERRSDAEAELLPGGPRTVIVAGDARAPVGRWAAELAHRGRVPLFAEPSSNARGGLEAITGYRLLLTEAVTEQIERVIMVGRPTLSRPVQRLLGRAGVELIIVADGAEWVDPAVNASRVVDAIDLEPGDAAWLGRWRQADDELRTAIEGATPDEAMITGVGLADRLWRALTSDDVLVVGSSNPVRDLDLAGPNPHPPTVYANRGLAGIDGTVSTAVGIALAHGVPTHALLGDLTLLHDLTGLIVGPDEPRPDLRLVVANDDGGSIFSTLEQGAEGLAAPFERIFGTPTRVDLAPLCAGLGIPHRLVKSYDDLDEVLASPPAGVELVEVPLDRTSRRAQDDHLGSLGAHVAARLLTAP